jgi:predicted DNA-binding transcriptional regulator AlpA
LISVDALAAMLHKTPRGVYNLKYRNVLPPAVRVGGRIFWLAADIEAWLQASKEVV